MGPMILMFLRTEEWLRVEKGWAMLKVSFFIIYQDSVYC